MRTALRGTVRFLSLLAGICLLVIMFLTFADVTRRNLLDGRSIPGAVEYNEIIIVGLVALSLANTQRTGDHIAVSLVTSRLPDRVARGVRAVGLALAAVVLAWMTYRSWQIGLRSFQTGEFRIGLAQVPVWPARLLIPFGLFFLLLQVGLTIYDELVGLFRGEEAVHDQGPTTGVGI